MKLFITGVSGFVGGAATRALAAKGHTVRAMSRSTGSDQLIRELGVEPVRCDLESVNADHVGTEATIVHGQDIFYADETYPLALDSPYPYCATKAQAEQLVLAAGAAEFTTIVLRPHFIWGMRALSAY